MPGFNRKGPEGQGPMTGRKMGRCTNYGAGRDRKSTSDPDGKGANRDEQESGRGSFYGRGRGMKKDGSGRQNRSRSGY